MHLFVFGMGYSSTATIAALRGLGVTPLTIAGTAREITEKRPNAAVSLHKFDGNAPGTGLADDLLAATHLIISIPPGDHGDPVLTHYRDTLAALPAIEWLCYFSTVGVYGDFGGALVDERAEIRPLNHRSRHRLTVEAAWRDYAAARGAPLLILRLAGIYGPGRSAFDKLRAGTARRIVKPGQVFNRIHVDDIGRVTALAAEQKLAGIFNLADDEPAPPQDVVAHAAGLLGLPAPPETPFDIAEMTPMARSFYADNKRVSNAAIKRALGIELLYPNYRDGLAAIMEEENQ